MILKVLSLLTLVRTVTCLADFSYPIVNFENIFDYDLYESVLDAELCEKHLSEMNLLEFYDASFRLPQGVLQGNYLDYGNYFQCLAIKQDTREGDIEGKHCMIRFPTGDSAGPPMLPLPAGKVRTWSMISKATIDWVSAKVQAIGLNANLFGGVVDSRTSAALTEILPFFQLGVCIPKSCTVQRALQRYFNNSLISAQYEERYCRLPADKLWVTADYVAVVVLSLIGLITLISTGYELHHVFIAKKDPKTLSRLHTCCSLYSNAKRLFTFRSNPAALECLDGIRSLSTIWIIVGHALLTMAAASVANVTDLIEWYQSIQATYLKAANLSVDTFFLLSGLLVVYSNASKQTQTGLIKNLHLFYLNRLLRLFPVLAATILLQASLLHHIDDGPNWHFEGMYVQTCRQYWWAALLHIQNYYNLEESCIPHTWYLSVDTQLYLISPLVLFWVLGERKSGWLAVTVGVLASVTACALYVFLVVDVPDFFRFYYANTLTRAPPFFVGMMLGFILHVYSKQKLIIPKWIILLGWSLSLLSTALVFYAYHAVFAPDFDSAALSNIHDAFSRTFWAAALGWLVFACVHGYGGPVQWFLSLTVWKFVARVSYAMYLVHYPMQFVGVGAALAPVFFSVKHHLMKAVTDLSVTIIVSVVLCIIIEAPISTLQNMYVGTGTKKPAPNNVAEKMTATERKETEK